MAAHCIVRPAHGMEDRKFDPAMTVNDALSFHPSARWVFAAYHLGGCTSCAVSTEETLAEVATGYGIPLEKLLGDLNSLLADQNR
jgi:hybrid cluster-associated redox disulfide protein